MSFLAADDAIDMIAKRQEPAKGCLLRRSEQSGPGGTLQILT
jgi:hypothetical protein